MLQVEKRKKFRINNIERDQGCLYLDTDIGSIRIVPQNASIIRISYTQKGSFSDSPGTGVEKQESYGDWTYRCDETEIVLSTELLQVKIARETGSICYFDSDGKRLLKEKEEDSKCLEAFSAYKTVIDEHAIIKKIDTPDGVKNVIEYATREFDKELYHTTVYWEWQDDEVLYGLGQPDDGILNLRGTVRYLHQANLKIAVPMLLSTKGYGILIPTGSPAIFSDVKYRDSFFYTEADEELNYYFIYGPSFDQIIKGYRKLTGKAAILPEWAFGYMQSQERYETQEEILQVAAEIRERQIGADVMILDWHYWDDGLWGQKGFDKSRFPMPGEMIDKLHKDNFHFMISIWPTMDEKSSNYKEMQDKDLLLPMSDIYDAFCEEGRKLYWEQAKEGLQQYGVDAWWCDSSEPLTPEWTRAQKPLPEKMYEEFLEQTRKMMPADLGNAYGLFHAKGIFEGQRSEEPQKRVVNLTRSGYTGAQKYGTILWSGDIYASWENLKKQIAAGLNFCASGLPYWTFDIGAFFVKSGKPWFWAGEYEEGNEDPGYRELFTRWYQLGAFLPIFRNHGTDVRRELWAFGEPGDMFYDALIAANRLRYQLLPYIYSCAGKVWEEDATIMRLLAFDFPEDKNVLRIDDQYLFGPAVMVCPVTTPMYYEKKSKVLEGVPKTREVYLPEGADWYDFWTDEKYEGGQRISVCADIQRIPLFIRAGSIIPMSGKRIECTQQLSEAGIYIHVYPGKDVVYELYEDAGDGYGYEQGEFSMRKIEWKEKEQKLEIQEMEEREWAVAISGSSIHSPSGK